MNKKNRTAKTSSLGKLTLLLSVGSFLGIMFLGYLHFSKTTKIAFVRTDELLGKYEGMILAKQQYQLKAEKWQGRIDTLKKELETGIKVYEGRKNNLSQGEKNKEETKLRKQQEDMVRYSNEISKQAEEEDRKMTEGVLNQVNAFLELYGKNHQFDIVLGANGSGNIIYGSEARDITNEVLLALNKEFHGE